MKLSLTIAGFFLTLSTTTLVSFGQQITCSCEERAPYRTCHETVTCDNGCSALCGSKNTCLLSCGSDLIDVRITLKLGKKKGEEIASLLSDQTQTKIEFASYRRNAHTRYDLEVKGDDIWNVLMFLDKFGHVKVGGVDFLTLRKLRKLRREMRTDKKASMTLTGIPAKDAVTMLPEIYGLPFSVKSGAPERLVSIALHEVTLSGIVTRLSSKSDVNMEKKQGASINRKRHGHFRRRHL